MDGPRDHFGPETGNDDGIKRSCLITRGPPGKGRNFFFFLRPSSDAIRELMMMMARSNNIVRVDTDPVSGPVINGPDTGS